MLKVPAFRYHDDVTVFQDDAEFNRFYIIPGFPRLRRDEQDRPVFLLIKYAFSDESRAANPELARGGGYLAFDSELKVDQGLSISAQAASKAPRSRNDFWVPTPVVEIPA